LPAQQLWSSKRASCALCTSFVQRRVYKIHCCGA
jgi:hypothetical protein